MILHNRQDLSLAHYKYFCLDCENCLVDRDSERCDHTSHPRRPLKDIGAVAAHIRSAAAGHSRFQPVQNFVNLKGCQSFSHVDDLANFCL